MKLNLDYLLEMLWEYLALTCIYTKKRGRECGGGRRGTRAGSASRWGCQALAVPDSAGPCGLQLFSHPRARTARCPGLLEAVAEPLQ